MVVGRYVVTPLMRSAARTGSRELIMAITLTIVVGIAAATGASGLSVALGAFLAGLLLSDSEYRHQIEVDLEPFKGLLLGIFFVTVGMVDRPRGGLATYRLDPAGAGRPDRRQGERAVCRGARCSGSRGRSRPRSRCCSRRAANSRSS